MTSRLTDEWCCPRCGSKVVLEGRGDENQILHVGTACGADWYSDFNDEMPEYHQRGWNYNSHVCSLILGLMAERRGAEEDRDRKADQLLATQQEYMRAVHQVERAVRLLTAAGMGEAMARAALDMEEPTDG